MITKTSWVQSAEKWLIDPTFFDYVKIVQIFCTDQHERAPHSGYIKKYRIDAINMLRCEYTVHNKESRKEL